MLKNFFFLFCFCYAFMRNWTHSRNSALRFRKYFQLVSFPLLSFRFPFIQLNSLLWIILFRVIVAINLKEMFFQWTKFSLFRHPFFLTLLDLILSCRLNFLIFFFLINPVSITCLRFIYFKLVGTSPLLPLLIPLLIPYASSSSGEFLDQLFLLLASSILVLTFTQRNVLTKY